jgi:hypothetical protein
MKFLIPFALSEVEWPSFPCCEGHKGTGFDKLSPNGEWS